MIKDFHRNIMYAAAQCEIIVDRRDNLYRLEGFEIKVLKHKVCISGYVFMESVGKRTFEPLFETTSLKLLNPALDRVMQVSREISRIKKFDGFDIPEIQVQMDISHHDFDATSNFIAEDSLRNECKWEQSDYLNISARYFVDCVNGPDARAFLVADERYTQRRLDNAKYLPTFHDFTRKHKYSKDDFDAGCFLDDIQNLHKIGLPYKIMYARVSTAAGYDLPSIELMHNYGVPVPEPKIVEHKLAVKVPRKTA